MTEEELHQMIDTVAASTMANKAILACLLAGVPVTVDNVALAVAPWLNPNNIHAERLAAAILRHVETTFQAGDRLSPSGVTH